MPKEPHDGEDGQPPSSPTGKSPKTITIAMKQVIDPNTSIMTNLMMTPETYYKQGQSGGDS